jgi:tripartite-type tricarboxylate transporter receptor subunit TctC
MKGAFSRRAIMRAGAGIGLLASPLATRAQGLEAGKPLRILVGFAAGGSTDTAARIVAAKIQERTGASTIVDNKPGASGTIATEAGARATPDGSTIVLAAMTSTVMAKLTFPSLPYDPQLDLAPIGHLATFQLALAVSPSLPINSVADFGKWAKASPPPVNFGVPGLGGHSHFFGAMLGKSLDVPMQPVPYKGSAPMLPDLASGQLPIAVSALSDFVAAHQAGKVRIVGSTGSTRSPTTPTIPTFAESGFPTLTSVGWIAFYAPAKTPRPVVEALGKEIATILALPDVRDRLAALGMEANPSGPAELAAFDDAELKRWRPIVASTSF